MDEEDVMYLYNRILFYHKQEGNPAICNNTDRPRGHYTKSEKDRERQILYDIIYMWNLKKN